jgi:hypothetical protein
MSQQFSVEQESPGLVKVIFTGRVGPKEWRAALGETAGLLPEGRRTSVLVSADGFEGWGAGDWDDSAFLSFQRDYDPRIGRMAIVADKKWEDQALMFAGKGLRKIEIEFFTPGEIEWARQWLRSTPPKDLA